MRQALFRLQQEGFVEVLFRSGWRVLPFDFDKFEQLYDLRMVLETTAVQRLCAGSQAVQAKRGDQAAMLLRAHIETSQAEVRKIMPHQVHLARQAGSTTPR